VPEGEIARKAFCVTKQTYSTTSTGWERTDSAPLSGDFWSESHSGPIPADTDFFIHKPSSDVVVQGSAYARGGSPFESLEVAVHVGRTSKRAAIFGERVARLVTGRLIFDAPSPVTSMPVDWHHAYGGMDERVAPWRSWMSPLRHPGCYPRNAYGRGYVIGAIDESDTVPLPSVEDPDDLLTPERLLSARPDDWWKQPVPCGFDFMLPSMFPRFTYCLGQDALLPSPEDESLPEVRRGFLPHSYRERRRAPGAPPIASGYFQVGTHGMVFNDLTEGTPIRIMNMHPERSSIAFAVPKPPSIEWEIEGQRSQTGVRLLHVICRPNEEKVSFVYATHTTLPRAFIPKIHKYIPVGVRIDGGPLVSYDAPQPIRERLEDARRRMTETSR
jgi:hypothetical protein